MPRIQMDEDKFEALCGEVHQFIQMGRSRDWIWRHLKITHYRLNQCLYRLGIAAPRKYPNWSPEEDALLEETCNLCLRHIALRFKKAGFYRSESAISKRIHQKQLGGIHEKGLSLSQLARLLGAHESVIRRWIRSGKLKARREFGVRRPGVHESGIDPQFWSIATKDIGDFLVLHPFEWRMRSVPDSSQGWVVDLINQSKCRLVDVALRDSTPKRVIISDDENDVLKYSENPIHTDIQQFGL